MTLVFVQSILDIPLYFTRYKDMYEKWDGSWAICQSHNRTGLKPLDYFDYVIGMRNQYVNWKEANDTHYTWTK